MKTKKGAKPSASEKIQQKPQFKKQLPKKSKHSNKKVPGAGNRNQFTFAEEKRLQRIREQNERKAEKEAKLLIAKKEKKRKLKIFAKKNHRGQPVMQGRMELLLEKIEKRVGNK